MSRNQRQEFRRVVIVSTALGFGFLAGVIQSARPHQDYTFEFSIWTLVAAVVGAAAGWLLWVVIFALSDKRDRQRRS